MTRCFPALVVGCLLWSAFGIVPEPKNVRIKSVNLNSILQWDPPTFHKENITYTVQYRSLYKDIESMSTVNTKWDFSSLPVFGNYTMRVRAESDNEQSDWVNIIFKPLDDTIIGAPDVKVKSESGSLHIDFTGPVAVHEMEKWPLKDYYGSWFYKVLYWKKSNREEVLTKDTKYNSEILPGLDPWTIYCLQVQAIIPELNKTGELSEEFCDRTTDNGITPVWIIVTVLLVSMLVVLVSVPACFFTFSYIYRQARYVFYPKYYFPQHLKEFLSEPSCSSQFLSPHSPEEDHSYDKLTVISEESENGSDETSNTKEQLQDSQEEIFIAEKVSAFGKGSSTVFIPDSG
ncbi:interleukin-10 receptor subunit beta [Emydura macquarii macquarii]|uniref:interleukin-10 receptor subunit beta n=1 Tax=Emydura macquarii macquarii TaxID=1129001 RepID=UPI00352A53C0